MYIYICWDIVKAGWSSRTFSFVPEQVKLQFRVFVDRSRSMVGFASPNPPQNPGIGREHVQELPRFEGQNM